MDDKLKEGDKVKFTDGLGMTREGVLTEKSHVVSTTDADIDLTPGKWEDVDYWTWEIKTKDGVFVSKEELVRKIYPN